MSSQDNFPANRTSKLRRRCATGVVASGVALLVFGIAGSAQAGSEFESGFEYELGRITANHLAAVTQLVFGAHIEPEVVVVETNYRPRPRPHYRHGHRNHARVGHRKHARPAHHKHARAHRRGYGRHDKIDRHRSYRRHDEGRRHDVRKFDRRHNRKHDRRDERRHDRRDDRKDRNDNRHDRNDTRTRS